MKIILVWLVSFFLAGLIVSPFFWLRFLKKKGVWTYIILSTLITFLFFLLYVRFGYGFISDWTAKINADIYYFFYDILDFAIYITIFFFIISPFIFTKIVIGRISLRNFFISLLLSIIIFVTLFVYWALVLLPGAFSHLHDYL